MTEYEEAVVYVVGRVVSSEEPISWELQGIFDWERDAVKSCVDGTYFVGPVVMNSILPHNTVEWVGAYYPKLEV